ncbi:heavy metal-responsive transcriptional regulator [Caldalkalibacillus mannanilyticus]|uniref:heavy metal-responsive transcriptional regulator n=1 Tax=Caldalkalibacillus mannanilyticus TaxID=1418 RepID=UPI0004682F99|nr:heavy metal-responsive transcriptional regulator [Caldalkalibacillus mannanilyticus]
MKRLTIGQVAKAANVHIETVRYYEKKGLIPTAERTEAGYRMFTAETVEDIDFIKNAQRVGFTLHEIKELLALHKSSSFTPTEEMYHAAQMKVQAIEEQIKQLQNFKALLELITHHPASELPLSKETCPILTRLHGKEGKQT